MSGKFKILFTFIFSMAVATQALGLDPDGAGDRHPDLRALYTFDETTGPYLDSSGVGAALNLELEDETAVAREGGYVNIRQDTVIRSTTAATKIINNCSDQMTIEMWIRNDRTSRAPVEVENEVPHLIAGLTQANGDVSFGMSQFYNDGDAYRFDSGGEMVNTRLGLVQLNELQHIFAVRRAGEVQLFIGDENRVSPRQTLRVNNGLNISNNARLTIGQKHSFNPNGTFQQTVTWKGEMHMLAIYCRALTDTEIMGELSPEPSFESFIPDPNAEITPAHLKAAVIYQRLAGVKTPIDNPVIGQMATDIQNGNLMLAASRASSENGFFNITVRDFAARMSTRDETVNTELNDFVAAFIGIARDGLSAKELLTEDFYYRGDPNTTAAPDDAITDFLTSNNHYAGLDNLNYDLANVLVRRTGQQLYNGTNAAVPNPDPAGVLTSRAFLGAHAVAGTNRRLVEFAFREFLCVPMEKWSDSSGPDNMIGRDIDRFPAGDHQKFTTSCRSCHSNMDGLRGAFSQFSFNHNFVKNAFVMAPTPGNQEESASNMLQNPVGVAAKYNHNENTFAGGWVTLDNSFVNNSNRGANSNYFGWSGDLTGRGIRAFGQMIADSQRFPRCMAQRTFRSVCKREPAAFEMGTVEQIGDDFAQNGYNLKYLFERIVTTTECIGR